ncbi:hypothetical protein PV703_08070 [Streptomyces sp. ME01-24h]|nr:hypothetical protein [Streptomyces sp. ME19-03-3]MDX3353277.1 hypothetical protein [Streptomyces sp. ME01-24h]
MTTYGTAPRPPAMPSSTASPAWLGQAGVRSGASGILEGHAFMQSYASVQLASPVTYFQTAAFCCLVAVVLIRAGRVWRRAARGLLTPDEPVRMESAPPAGSASSSRAQGNRTVGRVYLCFGWFLVLGAVVNLINGFRSVWS